MRVRIAEQGLFDCGDAELYRQLRRLFMRASQGQHELHLDDPEQVLSSDFWRVACAEMDREEWEELVSRTLSAPKFAPADESRCTVVASSPPQRGGSIAFALTPLEVGAWAEQPLQVLLENVRDGVLVHLAVRVSESERLQDAFENGWLVPDGRGGSTEVLHAARQAKAAQRFFVIIDSDREEPGGQEGRTAQRLRKLLGEVWGEGDGCPLHVLSRRELENYVPKAIWEVLISQVGTTKARARGVEHRKVLVYRWLLRLIEQEGEAAARHGKDALETVVAALKRQAERPLSGRLVQELLLEWQRLTPEARSVDDLKVRFGPALAERAVQHMGEDNFDTSWLEAEVIEEFREMVRKLEEWL